MNNYITEAKNNKTVWAYELNMWKNPILLIMVWKIFILCSIVPALVVLFSTLQDGFVNSLLSFLKVFFLVAGIITILIFIAYIILGIIYGGKYMVIFEMDNDGIKHTQMKRQFKKAECIALVGILAGAIKKSPTIMGSSILSGSKNFIYSKFNKVRSIKSFKNKNTIKIRTSNGYNNQIYVDEEHYYEVLKTIIERCPKDIVVS